MSKSGEQSIQTSKAKEMPIYGGEKEPKTIVWKDDDEIEKEQLQVNVVDKLEADDYKAKYEIQAQ